MRQRSPGVKLILAGLVGVALLVPLLLVYALVGDRQHQARVAQQSIEVGWAGPQTVSGPLLVIPYTETRNVTESVDGREVTRTAAVRKELFLTPETHSIGALIAPDVKERSIYRTVIYLADLSGTAKFALPDDLSRLGVERSQMLFDEAELRFGISDPRGLQDQAQATVNGEALALQPGNGTNASGGSGFFGPLQWDGQSEVDVEWSYSARGSRLLNFVPQGGLTTIEVESAWPHPSFGGSFLPDENEISADGFTASWSVANLALGQPLILKDDPMPPVGGDYMDESFAVEAAAASVSKSATIRLIEPVDTYSQVDRSVKYGFLFIGFTFLAFLMFDVVGGARVAMAEYLLTGAGLVLFFVMLLAFAEVIGFMIAYLVASTAIVGLLTAYSAAVLASWGRAKMIAGLLVGLYATLYVLLSLEAWSLMIGSLLLFAALAAVMYATRAINWSGIGSNEDEAGDIAN